VTPYDSIANVAAGIYPFLPVRWLIRDPYDSASRIARVRAPTLVVVAEHDEVIPRARTDALVARFPQGQARVELIRGATHNALDYEALLPAFLGS
jgi:pimeloyl-ACP methyl ester carboxylesterase